MRMQFVRPRHNFENEFDHRGSLLYDEATREQHESKVNER